MATFYLLLATAVGRVHNYLATHGFKNIILNAAHNHIIATRTKFGFMHTCFKLVFFTFNPIVTSFKIFVTDINGIASTAHKNAKAQLEYDLYLEV